MAYDGRPTFTGWQSSQYHQGPQYGYYYTQGPPIITPGSMPRTQWVSPGMENYFHSPPPRSSSPPAFYAERNSYFDTSTSKTAHARQACYGEYAVPSSPPPSFHAEDTSTSKTAHARQACYGEDAVPSSPPPSFHAEKGSYYDTTQARAAQSQPQYEHEPKPPKVDNTPTPYTYDDDEPDRIPIAPMPWNNYSSTASKEELISFFVGKGIHPKRAAAAVDREFSAHAPQYFAGCSEPGLPRAQIPAEVTNAPPPRPREKYATGSTSRSTRANESGYRSSRTREPTPPPAGKREGKERTTRTCWKR
ncbi:hypothetical protein ONS95_004392 [Cadophora gregata]|uniref:uncharacterized protein n=1 Tax=Cadophora gregata TaxID=51156 RepID=UPI0026DCF7BF|nr:uncharacterized protein ONS95_004392 [Cadophora gregata]KAK0105214.1 hypothetical protein ONS96_004614 [Cadophora gregata f. sp. sojae]KAK0105880.1 hypothetical protein ONS95_004392 [Cadophora gregata]